MSSKFYEKFERKPSSKETKKNNNKSSFSSKEKSQKLEAKNKKPSYNNNKKNSFKDNKEEKKYTLCNSLFKTDKLDKDTINILQHFDDIVQGVRPLNSKQLQQLPDNIKALSHQLTDKRSERRLGYMNDYVQLSSYVRYYTWWNLVRLTRLFSNLPQESFPNKECICLDLGTGPLTVINALWLARPELRKIKLTWYCLDVSSNSMVLGEDLYMSIAARTCKDDESPWNIIRVKGSFGTSLKKKADFITCANMFNELDQAGDMPPEYQVKKYCEQLKVYSTAECKYLLIEPGVPKATRTITLMRSRFISSGKEIVAPCPSFYECPMNGYKAYTGSHNKWCNFCFSTEDAPSRLLKLSEMAKLPKERATLIFISVVNKGEKKKIEGSNGALTVRITSDPFRLPNNKAGYYGCSHFGLTLVTTKAHYEKVEIDKPGNHKDTLVIKGPLASGDLLQVKLKGPDTHLETDEKSGAVIINL